MADRFVRLKIEVPAGVTVRTRALTSNPLRKLDSLLGIPVGLFNSAVETHEVVSDRLLVLELDVPETELAKVLSQLHAQKG